MEEKEAIDAFVAASKGNISLPVPFTFELYAGNSRNYPNYTPEKQKDFVFQENLTKAAATPVRAFAPSKNQKKERRKSSRMVSFEKFLCSNLNCFFDIL